MHPPTSGKRKRQLPQAPQEPDSEEFGEDDALQEGANHAVRQPYEYPREDDEQPLAEEEESQPNVEARRSHFVPPRSKLRVQREGEERLQELSSERGRELAKRALATATGSRSSRPSSARTPFAPFEPVLMPTAKVLPRPGAPAAIASANVPAPRLAAVKRKAPSECGDEGDEECYTGDGGDVAGEDEDEFGDSVGGIAVDDWPAEDGQEALSEEKQAEDWEEPVPVPMSSKEKPHGWGVGPSRVAGRRLSSSGGSQGGGGKAQAKAVAREAALARARAEALARAVLQSWI